MDVLLAAYCLGSFALTCGLTAAMRRYAIWSDLLDHPNDRSSHTVPTPRGGGVAIVLVFTACLVAWGWNSAPLAHWRVGLLGSGLLVALVGFLDDRAALPARWRFLAHACAAVWVLWMLNGIPAVPLFGHAVNLGWFGLVLAAIYLVWMVNLYNFMDGIDGIASIEAITVCLGGALCWWWATATAWWVVPVAFACCVAGFLVWNFPPAKIFMGDAGSGFIGMVLGFFSLWAGQESPQVFFCWLVLLGCFMVDATTTLVRRVRRGERFHEAHRSHAYQYASRRHASHRRVSLTVGAINLFWLLPVAGLVATGRLDGLLAVAIAYTPLAVLAFRYKAGVRAEQSS